MFFSDYHIDFLAFLSVNFHSIEPIDSFSPFLQCLLQFAIDTDFDISEITIEFNRHSYQKMVILIQTFESEFRFHIDELFGKRNFPICLENMEIGGLLESEDD